MADLFVRLQHLIYRNRSISFTPSGTRFVLLTLAVGVAAVNTGNNLLYLILGMMLSLIIVSGVLSEQSLRKIRFDWKFPSSIFARQPATAEICVQNRKKFLPSLSFRIQEKAPGGWNRYIFKLLARESINDSFKTVFKKRGHQNLGPLVLHTTFPFGFFHKKLVHPQIHPVVVFPPVYPIELAGGRQPLPHDAMSGEGLKKGQGGSLHSLRDYTPHDDARAIHWKASARETRVLLKEFEQEDDNRVLIFLSNHLPAHLNRQPAGETGFSPDFERGIKMAASVAASYQKKGFLVGLKTLSSPRTIFSNTNGSDELFRELALLRLEDLKTSQKNQARWFKSPDQGAQGGERILIMPGQDPLWEEWTSYFTKTLRADDLRWRTWESRWEGQP